MCMCKIQISRIFMYRIFKNILNCLSFSTMDIGVMSIKCFNASIFAFWPYLSDHLHCAKFNPFSSPALDAPVIAGGNSSTDVDNDGEKITDNALNVLDANLEQLNHQQGSEAAAAATAEEDVTFAGKVKVKRVNRAYPYAAFIMGGDEKIRTKISRKHFTAFTKHYNDRCDELPDEEQLRGGERKARPPQPDHSGWDSLACICKEAP